MARRRKTPRPAPLPQLGGIAPVRLQLPEKFPDDLLLASADSANPTIADYLIARFYAENPSYVLNRFSRGEIVDDDGTSLPATAAYAGGTNVWYYRELSPEPEVPTDLPVLFEDEWVLAVDKPHFLPTTPRGMYVANTALTFLRVTHQLPALTPAHRLDRHTAGVLLFTKTPEARAPFQIMFERRELSKTYQAICEPIDGLEAEQSLTVRSRIDKEHGTLQVHQTNVEILSGTHQPLPPETHAQKRKRRQSNLPHTDINAESNIRCLEKYWSPIAERELARFELRPHTGKTHQLRVHLMAAGSPIFGDPLYPQILASSDNFPSLSLQLLAQELEFIHPLTGQELTIRSQRTLKLSQQTTKRVS